MSHDVKPALQQMVIKAAVPAPAITPRLKALVRMVEPKSEHTIRSTADRFHRPQEASHLQLSEQQNLRSPPAAQLPPLCGIHRWIQGD